DDGGADVDLPLEHAVPGAGRVGVVEVVPGLAEGRDGQPPDVPRLVADLELLLAEDVADRVDRPGDVVEQADAYERAPEERGQRALPGPGDQAADDGGQRDGGEGQRAEPAVQLHHVGVAAQVGGVL